MEAFWTRPCAVCGKPIPKGAEMRYENKKAFHPGCWPTEQPSVFAESEHVALAKRLGYEPHSEVLGGTLRVLSFSISDDDATGSGASTFGFDPIRAMPGSFAGESEETGD